MRTIILYFLVTLNLLLVLGLGYMLREGNFRFQKRLGTLEERFYAFSPVIYDDNNKMIELDLKNDAHIKILGERNE